MNNQEFVETLLRDGLDNNTIIEHVKSQQILIDALACTLERLKYVHESACLWWKKDNEEMDAVKKELEALKESLKPSISEATGPTLKLIKLSHDRGHDRTYYRSVDGKRLYAQSHSENNQWYLCSKDGEPQSIITFKLPITILEKP